MKKVKLLATFVLMIITISTFTIISRATTGIVNEDTIKIRKEPNETSTVIDLLNEGDEVEILETADGWYKVKATTELGKITGYISKELVDVENKDVNVEENVEEATAIQENIEIEENNEYTLLHEIKLKALPLIYSKPKAQITGNIKIIEIINDWARVESDTGIGWIRNNVLRAALTRAETVQEEQNQQPDVQEPQPEAQEEVVQEEQEPEIVEINKTGYVSTDGLRVRKGPSTDTEEITSLSKNDEVKIIGKSGKWYKIDLDGETGYVSAKYISDTKIPETTSRSGSTLKNETTTQQTVPQEEAPKVEETPVEPETSAPSTTGTTGAAIVEYAKQYLGYKYVSGGASPAKGFDCSGFTTYVYKNFGISLNRSSRDQIKNGVAVEKSNLQLGDLVIFNNEANTAIGHVGIYIGDGNFIHASNPKDGVKITTLLSGYYKIRYVGARRVI